MDSHFLFRNLEPVGFFRPLLAILVVFGWTSVAQRSVDIAIVGSQSTLALSNPSGVPVNYDISCYQANGSTQIINSTGQVVAPNAKVDVPVSTADSGKCAGNVNPVATFPDKDGKNIHVCGGSVTYAAAPAQCGVGNQFCMPPSRYSSCSSWFDCSYPAAWVKSEAPTDFWDNCTCSGWGYDYGFAANALTLDGCSSTGWARKDTTSASEYWTNARPVAKTDTRAVVCCEQQGNYSSYCRVTINNTDSVGRLISPSFKGGAAF